MNTNINIDNSNFRDNNNIGNTFFITLQKYNNKGLNLLTQEYFDNYISDDKNLENWKRGFDFQLQDIKSNKHFKRVDLVRNIIDKLEGEHTLLITGTQGIGKTTILMEIICELFEKGKTVLFNLDNSELPPISDLIGFLEEVLENNTEPYIVIDNVHSLNMAIIFHLWDKLSSHSKGNKIKFLFSARQPAYDRLIQNNLNLVEIERHRESIRKFNLISDRIFEIPKFSPEEIRDFMLKYPESVEVRFSLAGSEAANLERIASDPNKLFEFLQEVTNGLPVILKYFTFNNKDGIIQDIERTYERHLHTKVYLEVYILIVLLETSEIRINDALVKKLSVEKEFYELLDIVIQKKSDNTYSTMHSIWNLHFFEHYNNKNAQYIKTNTFKDVFKKIIDNTDEGTIVKIIQTAYLNYKEFSLTREILEESFNPPDCITTESLYSLLGTFMTYPYYDNRLFDKVIELCERSLKINPKFIPALINKSAAHIQQKEHSKALQDSQQILLIDITHVSGWINKGIALYGLNEYNYALCHLEKALLIDPLNAETWYNKGLTYSKIRLFSHAINCFNHCLSLDNQHVHSIVMKGNAEYELKDYGLALVSFIKAEELDPTNLNCKNGKGLCYFELGEPDTAIEIFDQIIKLQPYYFEAWYNKVICLSKTHPEQIPQVIEDAKKFKIIINLLN